MRWVGGAKVIVGILYGIFSSDGFRIQSRCQSLLGNNVFYANPLAYTFTSQNSECALFS